MWGHLLTTCIEGAFDDPVLWGGDPNYRGDTLGRNYTHGNVHFVIRNVSMFGVNDYELRTRMSGASEATDETKLTSNPICATILASDAPGNMSQEPATRMRHVIPRMTSPIKNSVRHTHDGFLRLSAVLEELVETKVAGGHSGGNLIWDPPVTEGRRLYRGRCGRDPPDQLSIPIGRWSLARDFLFETIDLSRDLA